MLSKCSHRLSIRNFQTRLLKILQSRRMAFMFTPATWRGIQTLQSDSWSPHPIPTTLMFVSCQRREPQYIQSQVAQLIHRCLPVVEISAISPVSPLPRLIQSTTASSIYDYSRITQDRSLLRHHLLIPFTHLYELSSRYPMCHRQDQGQALESLEPEEAQRALRLQVAGWRGGHRKRAK